MVHLRNSTHFSHKLPKPARLVLTTPVRTHVRRVLSTPSTGTYYSKLTTTNRQGQGRGELKRSTHTASKCMHERLDKVSEYVTKSNCCCVCIIMNVYMYVCTYICMYVESMCVRTYVCIRARTCVCMCMHVCVCVCMCVCVYVCVY